MTGCRDAFFHKLIELIKKNKSFPQQFNPFTGETCPNIPNGYGPMVFAFLEYLSLLKGVNVSYNEVYWSGAEKEKFGYTQNIRNKEYALKSDDVLNAYTDGQLKFTFSHGLRVKTDLKGEIISVYGISENAVEAEITVGTKNILLQLILTKSIRLQGIN